jgi:hypothetical protein
VTPSERIDQMIAGIADWRSQTLAHIREIILDTDPEIIEEWKWMGSPVWEHNGIIAVGNPHKGKVKLTFMYGALLADPDELFNAGFNGNERRAIDFFEGDAIDEKGLKALIRAAIAFNQNKPKKKASASSAAKARKSEEP